MTVVLARTTTPEGTAAQDAAVEEARRRGEDLLVVDLSGEGSEVEDAEGVTVTRRALDARDRDPVGALLDVVAEVGASCIVMGIKHRTAVGKLLLGSAAQKILLEANVPVIAVKSAQT
ncbi:universal stress protein [Ornithinimicrobium avium]|uniref:Universal stress protein n=1 Tax=Ornithinimicrobium avium TaxID=2283195 RepID=A0A345NK04_9MICO|nr:universal stress protein [Ornithinimicrobium avium]AXH95362.1 universal stress protein [Ornithinimicrobium avium]